LGWDVVDVDRVSVCLSSGEPERPTRRMDGMPHARNLEVVRQFYGLDPLTAEQGVQALASDGIVWHVPGGNPVSGDYRGKDEVFGLMSERMAPLDEWVIDVRSLMANADLVLAIVSVRGRRRGEEVATTGGHVFRLHDGLIVEAWGFVDDQAGMDRFLSA
jgi:ketosteroid isomerase-like protein